MKYCIQIFFFLFSATALFAQNDSGLKANSETTIVAKPAPRQAINRIVRKDSVVHAKDSVRTIQPIDSTAIKDSIAKAFALADSLKADSLKKANASGQPEMDTSTYAALLDIPGLPFHQQPVFMLMEERPVKNKDELFYLITGVVFFLAIIRATFPKYFKNIFSLSFQTSFRQKQTRDQLLQDNMASLLMNVLFFITGGIYSGLIARQEGLVTYSYWWIMLYCTALLTIIYLGKYLFLSFSGWVFNEKEAANSYTFLVFLVNKITGVVLIPFLFLIAFSSEIIVQVAITVSLILLIILLFYRFIVGLGTIRRDLKVNPFHFFLYLCAVEILPLLLLYKALFNSIGSYI